MEIITLENLGLSLAKDFYISVGHNEAPKEGNKVLVAKNDSGKIVGAVRLAKEHEVLLLRTMEVAPEFQRQGIGSLLLNAFEKLLGNNECYCIAYSHLKDFYGKIGFKEIGFEEAPKFLQERVTDYRGRESNKDKKFIFMKKSKI